MFVDFSKVFDSTHREKIEQILLAYGFPKEIFMAIMILYKDMKNIVHSPDGDTDYFDIVTIVLKGDALAPFLFIICLDYILQTSIDLMKENGFTLKKARCKQYPVEIISGLT